MPADNTLTEKASTTGDGKSSLLGATTAQDPTDWTQTAASIQKPHQAYTTRGISMTCAPTATVVPQLRGGTTPTSMWADRTSATDFIKRGLEYINPGSRASRGPTAQEGADERTFPDFNHPSFTCGGCSRGFAIGSAIGALGLIGLPCAAAALAGASICAPCACACANAVEYE